MQPLDYVLIVVYLLFPIALGPWLARQVKSASDLFAAGSQSPWWLSGLSGYMTMFSSGTFVVWGGIAYKAGLTAVTICMTLGLSALIVAYTVASAWRRSGAQSAADFIHHRFGPGVVQMYTWLIMTFRMLGIAVATYSIAVIGSELIPIDPDGAFGFLVNDAGRLDTRWAIVLAGITITLYTVFGGLWSVLITDMLQFIVLTSSVLIVVPLVLMKAGGIGGFHEAAPVGFFEPTSGDYTWIFMAAWVIVHAVKIGGEWAFVQRWICVPTARDAVRSALLFGVLYLVTPIFWMTPAMTYRVLDPVPETMDANLAGYVPATSVATLTTAQQALFRAGDYAAMDAQAHQTLFDAGVHAKGERAYIKACQLVLPVGLIGMLLASMFAATASMANSELNVLAGALTVDIYAKLRRTPPSQAHLVNLGRLMTVVLGGLMTGLALMIPYLGGAEQVIITITGMFVGPMVMPTLWGLFSRRITWHAAVVTVGVTAIAAALVKFVFHEVPFIADNARLVELFIGLVVPTLLLVIFEFAAATETSGARAADRLRESHIGEHPSPLDVPLKILAISLGLQTVVFAFVAILSPAHLVVVGAAAIACGLGMTAILFQLRSLPKPTDTTATSTPSAKPRSKQLDLAGSD